LKASQSEYDPMISNYFTSCLHNKKRYQISLQDQIDILKNKHVKKEVLKNKKIQFKCIQFHLLNQSKNKKNFLGLEVAQKMLEKLGWRPGSRLGRNKKINIKYLK